MFKVLYLFFFNFRNYYNYCLDTTGYWDSGIKILSCKIYYSRERERERLEIYSENSWKYFIDDLIFLVNEWNIK